MFLIFLHGICALDFAILNKGDIIFQEIFIDNPEKGNNYYHNFGVDGLEPGARHNIHLYSAEDILICSFYLYGISQESYIIENVAIEENSIVYILPEHYREDIDNYSDLSDPDAVYGARPFDRDSMLPQSPDSLGDDDSVVLSTIEVFNYTNSPVFRAYIDRGSEKEDLSSDSGEEGDSTGSRERQDYLDGQVLEPSESRTLELPLEENIRYSLQLLGADGESFVKEFTLPMEADFLVFDDSDGLLDYEPVVIEVENGSHEQIVQLLIIDQESALRQELLKENILDPLEKREILLEGEFSICDIIARTAGKKNIYLLDQNLDENRSIVITEF